MEDTNSSLVSFKRTKGRDAVSVHLNYEQVFSVPGPIFLLNTYYIKARFYEKKTPWKKPSKKGLKYTNCGLQ